MGTAYTVGAYIKFQSTHPRGVRHRSSLGCIRSDCCFNPRTRVGCDPFEGGIGFLLACFNPRTRVGCDGASLSTASTIHLFQSTHPRGVRRASREQPLVPGTGFNPRTRVGCDGICVAGDVRQLAVSIHAPAWGATRMSCRGPTPMTPFQSTHPRGVRRPGHSSTTSPTSSFNPRTRVGCDAQI